jgi:glucokinase
MTNAPMQLRFLGDAESVASLTGIENNLLPYWLTKFDGHP